ncbi:hypothetical protein JZ751_028627 [Albula glossodonta]|uniref:Uncharacterized protein n=1 Tax=Albula glossodonta TaxID=121402 RepID=A0A8T2NF23_9TELE|nr:hypothetical protein JZ751_028627 [Albula glossodonta]
MARQGRSNPSSPLPGQREGTLQTVGPSHARTYTVAVYFKGERIGCGKGPSFKRPLECRAAVPVLAAPVNALLHLRKCSVSVRIQ